MSNNFLISACEEVDACIYSGDSLYHKEDQKIFKEYLKSWRKALKDYKKLEENEKESNSLAHVICCNDSIEFVYIGETKNASDKMTDLKSVHFQRIKEEKGFDYILDEYNKTYFWRIVIVHHIINIKED